MENTWGPAEVSLFPNIFVVLWGTSASRELPVIVLQRFIAEEMERLKQTSDNARITIFTHRRWAPFPYFPWLDCTWISSAFSKGWVMYLSPRYSHVSGKQNMKNNRSCFSSMPNSLRGLQTCERNLGKNIKSTLGVGGRLRGEIYLPPPTPPPPHHYTLFSKCLSQRDVPLIESQIKGVEKGRDWL